MASNFTNASQTNQFELHSRPSKRRYAQIPNNPLNPTTPPSKVPPTTRLGDSLGDKLKRRNIPWLGFFCLIGSLITIVLSLVLLLLVDNRPVWSDDGINKIVRPASYLSAILSANSIFLHVALNEGVTNTWWFRAKIKHATIGDLHDTWAHGTSLVSALAAGRTFTYVSLATIVLALIPLNAVLLQGAIATNLSEETTQTIVNVPIVQQLPGGFSASIDNNSYWDPTSSPFSEVWQQVLNPGMSRHAQYAYFGSFQNPNGTYRDFGCAANAICTAKVRGVGFNTSCTSSKKPYNLIPGSSSVTDTVFRSSMTMSKDLPSEFTLDLLWKENISCVGEYEVRSCVLKSAIVEYPVQIQMNNSGIYPGPYFSLPQTSTRNDDKLIKFLDTDPSGGGLSSVYAGIGLLVGNFYNSEFNVTLFPGNGSYIGGISTFTGHLTSVLAPSNSEVIYYNGRFGFCNLSFKKALQSIFLDESLDSSVMNNYTKNGLVDPNTEVDLTEVILEPLRRAMFFSSVNLGSYWFVDNSSLPLAYVNLTKYDDYVQDVSATQVQPVTRYQVRYRLWFASLAATSLIIAAITPTFWGFRLLKRKFKLSPVDTARVFNAPNLDDNDEELEVLLKHIGHISIQDLSSTGALSKNQSPEVSWPRTPVSGDDGTSETMGTSYEGRGPIHDII